MDNFGTITLLLWCWVNPVLLQRLPVEQAFAASVGQAFAKLYGKSSNIHGNSNIYAATVGGVRTSYNDRFNIERDYSPYNFGPIFRGDNSQRFPVRTEIALANLRRYSPDKKTYRPILPPKLIYEQAGSKFVYGNPVVPPAIYVESYAIAKIHSPSGSAISSAKSYVNGTKVGSSTFSLRGQQVPSDIR